MYSFLYRTEEAKLNQGKVLQKKWINHSSQCACSA